MPKSFNENERNIIKRSLCDAAVTLLRDKGLRHTTVDELVREANIPKGTFYLFYKSKEMLVFDVILKMHDAIHAMLHEKLAENASDITAEKLTDIILEAFDAAYDSGLLNFMTGGDMDLLIRKLPDEVVKEHISRDDGDFAALAMLFPEMDKERISVFSASFRALFFTICHRKEISETDFPAILRMLIRGLVIQMMEE